MKYDTALLIAAIGALIAVAIITPAYASNLQGSTYNEGNSTDVQYISISVGETQFSGAITNTVEYEARTVIDSGQGGRSTVYVPESTGTVTYNQSTIEICELGLLNLTISSSETLSEYDILIKGVEGTMTGTFYLRYWLNPPQNLNTGTATPDGVRNKRHREILKNPHAGPAGHPDYPWRQIVDIACCS